MQSSLWLRSCLLVAALVAAPTLASAQTMLLSGLGGVAGYGTSCLGPNDDGSSMAIDVRPAFPSGLRFFDRTHTTMYVNTNGNITFSGALPTFTPNRFPVANQPMIAPYWADVDIRFTGGRCMGAIGGTTAGPCHNPTENGVWWHLSPGRIVVTWDRVGYYSCHNDRRMNFQLILTAAPSCGGAGDFDVEFRYNRCEWTTGDASGGTGGFGGTPAQAGFDAGNTRDFVEIMGSRTSTIHTTLCTMSNVGMRGIWRFQIRRGTIMCPDAGRPCSTGMMGVCADGRTQCVGSGTQCVRQADPTPERCDGLDNNCNGMVDDGAMCPVGERCIRGVCTGECVEGSCFEGYSCQMGQCVETACATVTCPAGQRCRAGRCQAACDGIVCPAGQTCRAGRCVDPCAGLMCAAGLVCEDGVCQDRCTGGCRTCPTGRTCSSTGVCVESACAAVACSGGTVCVAGRCVDPCASARCPDGERCEMGRCVAAPMMVPDAGRPDAGTLPDSGNVGEDGGTGDDASTEEDGAVDPDAGDGSVDARRPVTGRGRAGCACRAAGEPAPSDAGGAVFALAAVAAALAASRRRRRAG